MQQQGQVAEFNIAQIEVRNQENTISSPSHPNLSPSGELLASVAGILNGFAEGNPEEQPGL